MQVRHRLFLLLFGGAVLLTVVLPTVLLRVESAKSSDSAACSRLVSLSPSLTQTVLALGLASSLVGVTRFCTLPLGQEVARVGGFLDPDLEAVVAARPTLVLLLPAQDEVRASLEDFGLRTLTAGNDTVDQILQTVGEIGRRCHVVDRAEVVVKALQGMIRRVAEAVPEGKRPRVLLSVGRSLADPVLREVHLAGPRTFLGELLVLAGGTNAYTRTEGPAYPALSAEGVLSLDPEVVLEVLPESDLGSLGPVQALRAWYRLSSLTAAREGRIHLVTRPEGVVPGPEFVWWLERFASLLHPVATPEADR